MEYWGWIELAELGRPMLNVEKQWLLKLAHHGCHIKSALNVDTLQLNWATPDISFNQDLPVITSSTVQHSVISKSILVKHI